MDNYTKMCDCPEIQDGWEPIRGDSFVIGGARPGDKHFSISVLGCCWEKCEGCSFEVNQLREDCLWLPTIEQLMGMVRKEYEDDYNLIARMYCRWMKPSLHTGLPAKELWLAFVMHELHGLSWSGAEWVDSKAKQTGKKAKK